MNPSTSETTPAHAGVRTYRGSCACGAVRYEVDADLGAGTTRCNCTHCTKSSSWGVAVKPAAFRLVQGAEALGDFSRSAYVHARFCTRCGIRVFGHGDLPQLGGAYCSVNLNTLDGVDLQGVPVRYLDGLHDTWAPLRDAPYRSPFAPSPA